MPPIRYPLPSMVILVLLSVMIWRGEAMTRPLRSALAARLNRVVEGPPVPSSTSPQVVAGPITRRALLLHDEVAATATPGGPPNETIRLRMFVDVFDVWPLRGEPTHYRVGNRRPIGWIVAADLLPWNTRLVVRNPAISASSLPVLSWTADAVEVAVWDHDRPWEHVEKRTSLRTGDLRSEHLGVWLSRDELLGLLRRTQDASPLHPPQATRLRAILGRLSDDRPIGPDDIAKARAALPALAFPGASPPADRSSERLARANEQWSPETSWGGLSFQFIPLDVLP